MAEVEPMSFTGMALFILDALAAGGYDVVKKSERPRDSDRPRGASGSAAVDLPSAALPSDRTVSADALAWTLPTEEAVVRHALIAPDPGAGRTSTGCEPAGLDPAPGPLSGGGAR